MKKLSTVSLFIFGVVLASILTAGLVFYQNNKNQVGGGVTTSNLVAGTLDKANPSTGTLVLDMQEIAKHNKSTDCFLLISGKVYNITSFFGSHPGGNSVMAQTCGTDATMAYATQDPNATNGKNRSAHSSSATSMLADYYIGDLNQSIGQQKITETNSIIAPANSSKGDDDDDEDDD